MTYISLVFQIKLVHIINGNMSLDSSGRHEAGLERFHKIQNKTFRVTAYGLNGGVSRVLLGPFLSP